VASKDQLATGRPSFKMNPFAMAQVKAKEADLAKAAAAKL
jgi:hypothetical protein